MRTATKAAALAAIVSGAGAPAAAADEPHVAVGQPGHQEAGAFAPGQLRLSSAGKPSGGVQANSFNAAQGVCNRNWVSVQAMPNGYVDGNCPLNATLTRTQVSSDGTFWGGLVGGSAPFCGWIDGRYVTLTTLLQTPNCGPGTFSRNDASLISGGGTPNAQIWTHWVNTQMADGVTTGAGRTIGNKNCTEYANFYPWSSTAHPADGLRPIAEGPGPRLALRYVAAHPDVNTGYFYDMVHDNFVGAGDGNWAFVLDSCITNKPPPGTY
jgi:hypothetical protein